jgi:transposase InsO family protein
MNVRARHGGRYFIIFIDDYMRYNIVYLISHKSEDFACLQEVYYLGSKSIRQKKIKTLRMDHDREYLSDEFKQICEKNT